MVIPHSLLNGSPWNRSRIQASCEQGIRVWLGLSDTWADGRLSWSLVAPAVAGDDAEPVAASVPVMWPAAAAAAAAAVAVDKSSSEAVVSPRPSTHAAVGRRWSGPAACVWPALSRWSASRRRTDRRTERQWPCRPSGRPSPLFDGASLVTGSVETCRNRRAEIRLTDGYAGTTVVRLVSSVSVVASQRDCVLVVVLRLLRYLRLDDVAARRVVCDVIVLCVAPIYSIVCQSWSRVLELTRYSLAFGRTFSCISFRTLE